MKRNEPKIIYQHKRKANKMSRHDMMSDEDKRSKKHMKDSSENPMIFHIIKCQIIEKNIAKNN